MKIVDVKVRVFRHTSRLVRDSDGHTHPGDPHTASRRCSRSSPTTAARAIASARPRSCGRIWSRLRQTVLIGRIRSTASACGRAWRTGSAAAPASSATGRWRSSSWRCGTSPDASSACRSTS